MEAVINKLKLKKSRDGFYIKIELSCSDGYRRTINNPFLSDPINFRKQIFGIMSACGSYDLMRLCTNNPNPKNVIGYYKNGLQILKNEKKEWFTYDYSKGEQICKKADKEKLKIIRMLVEQNLSDISIEEGTIENIVSRSGVFSLLFNSHSASTYYMCKQQIYYGFGEPINIGNPENVSQTKKAAEIYTSFIISLMKFFGIRDLLHFGGNIENLPIVEITINNNNQIDSITNPNTGMGLSIDKKYDIINKRISEKQKTKSLY